MSKKDPNSTDFVVAEMRRLSGGTQRVKTVLPRWVPPPRDRMRSAVYALRLPEPDGRWYVGETDDLSERIREHRREELKRKATFHYVGVTDKSAELGSNFLGNFSEHADGERRRAGSKSEGGAGKASGGTRLDLTVPPGVRRRHAPRCLNKSTLGRRHTPRRRSSRRCWSVACRCSRRATPVGFARRVGEGRDEKG